MSIEDKPGFRNASELLSKLTPSERERILESISQTEPELAEALKKSFYQFDDLQYLTPKMLVELLRELDLGILALALRGAKKETTNHILNNVSAGIKDELNETLLGPPRPVEHVTEAMDKVMELVVEKIDKGQIVLSKDSSETIID